MKEYKVKKLAKLIQTSFHEYNVEFNGEIVGKIEKHIRLGGWKAMSAAGRYIGSSNKKSEAMLWVVGETIEIEYKN